MDPDKIRRRYEVKNVAHIFADQDISVFQVNGNVIAVLFQVQYLAHLNPVGLWPAFDIYGVVFFRTGCISPRQCRCGLIYCHQETLKSYRFQQVVQCVQLITFHSVLAVGSSENDQGPRRQGLQQLHSADIRHIDVEEDEVDLLEVQELDRLERFTKSTLE